MVRNFPKFSSKLEKRSSSRGTSEIPDGICGNFMIHLISNRNFRIFRANVFSCFLQNLLIEPFSKWQKKHRTGVS